MAHNTNGAVASCLNKNMNYSYEEERLKSFKTWQAHFPVDASRLAKSGFYYTGKEDEVICFSCKGSLKNWNYGDVVQEKHSQLFPNCDFVKGKSNNIPIVQSKRQNDPKQCGMSSEAIKLSFILTRVDYNKMKSLTERFKTFVKWPVKSIDAMNLAKAGFFYLGLDDKVQCPFCKGIVSSWEADDDPLDEHMKHFPYCGFLPENLRDKQPKKDPWFLSESEDLCGNMKKTENSSGLKCKLLDKAQEHADLKKLGVHLQSNPAHPQQATLNARLRSFAKWPTSVPVSKDDLAKAGFFYIGIRDHTKCFHCNGGLCNWENGDDPWFEHARWFRNCDFLRLSKGQDFIDTVVKKSHSTKSELETENPSLLSEPLIFLVDEAMKSELVMKVLETGLFPPYVVRAAVLRQIKETGTSFSSEEELTIAVSFLKEEMENESLKMNDCQSSDSNGQNLSSTLNVHHIDFSRCSISIEDESSKTEETSASVSSAGINLSSKLKENQPALQKGQCSCIICMDNEVGVVFLPCGHLLACIDCAPALKLCPMCRKTIQATVRAYLP